jgi:hypothetical protein
MKQILWSCAALLIAIESHAGTNFVDAAVATRYFQAAVSSDWQTAWSCLSTGMQAECLSYFKTEEKAKQNFLEDSSRGQLGYSEIRQVTLVGNEADVFIVTYDLQNKVLADKCCVMRVAKENNKSVIRGTRPWKPDNGPQNAVEEESALWAVLWDQMMFGTITVSGRVQNAQGDGLTGVVAYVDYAGKGIVSMKTEVNTTFSFSCTNCSHIALFFEKDGYQRSEYYDIAFMADLKKYPDEPYVRRSIEAVSTNLVVVLVPQARPQDPQVKEPDKAH